MERLDTPKKLDDAICEAFEEVQEEFTSQDIVQGDNEIDPVNYQGYDGFMPFTNGGWDLMMTTSLYNVWSSGNFPEYEPTRKLIDSTIDNALNDSLIEFCKKNKTKLSSLFTIEQLENPTYDDINYHSLYDLNAGSLAEQLSEYENEYLIEGGTFWYQLRVLYFKADNSHNNTGEDELYFMAGTNTDFEYGRDKGFDISYEQTIKLKDITVEKVKTIVTKMAESI